MRVKWNRNLDGGTVRQNIDGSESFDITDDVSDSGSLEKNLQKKEPAFGLPPASSTGGGFLSNLFRSKKNRKTEDDQSVSSLSTSVVSRASTGNFERRVSLPARWKRRPTPIEVQQNPCPYLRNLPITTSDVSTGQVSTVPSKASGSLNILQAGNISSLRSLDSERIQPPRGIYQFPDSEFQSRVGDACPRKNSSPPDYLQQNSTLTKSASLSECQPQDVPTKQSYSSFSQSNKSLGPTAERANLFHTAKSFFTSRAKSIIKKSSSAHQDSDTSPLQRSASVTDYRHSSKGRSTGQDLNASTADCPLRTTSVDYEDDRMHDDHIFQRGYMSQSSATNIFSNLKIPGKKLEVKHSMHDEIHEKFDTNSNTLPSKHKQSSIRSPYIHEDFPLFPPRASESNLDTSFLSENFRRCKSLRGYPTNTQSSLRSESSRNSVREIESINKFHVSRLFPQLKEPDILEEKSAASLLSNARNIQTQASNPFRKEFSDNKTYEFVHNQNGFANNVLSPVEETVVPSVHFKSLHAPDIAKATRQDNASEPQGSVGKIQFISKVTSTQSRTANDSENRDSTTESKYGGCSDPNVPRVNDNSHLYESEASSADFVDPSNALCMHWPKGSSHNDQAARLPVITNDANIHDNMEEEVELTHYDIPKPDCINVGTNNEAKIQSLRVHHDHVSAREHHFFDDGVVLYNNVPHQAIPSLSPIDERNDTMSTGLLLFNGSKIPKLQSRDQKVSTFTTTTGMKDSPSAKFESAFLKSSMPFASVTHPGSLSGSSTSRDATDSHEIDSKQQVDNEVSLLSCGEGSVSVIENERASSSSLSLDFSNFNSRQPSTNKVRENCQIPNQKSSLETSSTCIRSERVFTSDTLHSSSEVTDVKAGRIKNGGENCVHDDEAHVFQQVTEGRFSSGLKLDSHSNHDDSLQLRLGNDDDRTRIALPDLLNDNKDDMTKVKVKFEIVNAMPPAPKVTTSCRGVQEDELFFLKNQEEVVCRPLSKIYVKGPSSQHQFEDLSPPDSPVVSKIELVHDVLDRGDTVQLDSGVSPHVPCNETLDIRHDGTDAKGNDLSMIINSDLSPPCTTNGYLNAVFSEVQLQCSLLRLESGDEQPELSENVASSDTCGTNSFETTMQLDIREAIPTFRSQITLDYPTDTTNIAGNNEKRILDETLPSKSVVNTSNNEILENPSCSASKEIIKGELYKTADMQSVSEKPLDASTDTASLDLKNDTNELKTLEDHSEDCKAKTTQKGDVSLPKEDSDINAWIERLSRKIQETSEIRKFTETNNTSTTGIFPNFKEEFGPVSSNFYNSSPDLNAFDSTWSTRNRFRMFSGTKVIDHCSTLPFDKFDSSKRIPLTSDIRTLNTSTYSNRHDRANLSYLSKSKSDDAIPYQCLDYEVFSNSPNCVSYVNPTFEDCSDVDASDESVSSLCTFQSGSKTSTWITDIASDECPEDLTRRRSSSTSVIISDDLCFDGLQDVSIGSGEAMWSEGDQEVHALVVDDSGRSTASGVAHPFGKDKRVDKIRDTQVCDLVDHQHSLVDEQCQTECNYERESDLFTSSLDESLPQAVGQVRWPSNEASHCAKSKQTTFRPSISPGKSRIPKKQSGGSKPIVAPRPVRPPMWLSKAELSQEIQHLSTLCEGRTKELNKLKLDTKHVTMGFDALAVVIRYMASDLNAFQNPTLAADLKNAQEKLNRGRKDLDFYEIEIEKLKVLHGKEIQDLSESLRHEHELKVKDLVHRHHVEITCLKEQQEKELRILQEALKQSCEEERLQLEKIVDDLQQELRKQREELEIFHQHELDDLEERLTDKQRTLQAELEKVQKQYEDAKILSQTMEEALNRDTDSKLQWISCKKVDLQNEVDSLKAVLEIKNNELHSLRKDNLEMQKELEELPLAREKIKMLKARAEDLKALMAEKVRIERRLSTEHQTMKEIYEKETKVNKRLSMENEELQWKLKQASESSLLSASIPDMNEMDSFDYSNNDSVIEIEVESKECFSPARSPHPSSSRPVFFTYMNQEELSALSPQSPRTQYKRIQPGSHKHTSPVSKLFSSPSPRKSRGIHETSSQSHEGTPCKLAKHISRTTADESCQRQRASSAEDRVIHESHHITLDEQTTSVEENIASNTVIDENSVLAKSEEVICGRGNGEFVGLASASNGGQVQVNKTEEGSETVEQTHPSEAIDPKTYYHMTFPVFKEKKSGDGSENETKSEDCSPEERNACDNIESPK